MLELFHAIGDSSSAKVRKFVVDNDLGEKLRFRNTTYEEVMVDLKARGGTVAPALWDGETLISGGDQVIEALKAIVPSP